MSTGLDFDNDRYYQYAQQFGAKINKQLQDLLREGSVELEDKFGTQTHLMETKALAKGLEQNHVDLDPNGNINPSQLLSMVQQVDMKLQAIANEPDLAMSAPQMSAPKPDFAMAPKPEKKPEFDPEAELAKRMSLPKPKPRSKELAKDASKLYDFVSKYIVADQNTPAKMVMAYFICDHMKANGFDVMKEFEKNPKAVMDFSIQLNEHLDRQVQPYPNGQPKSRAEELIDTLLVSPEPDENNEYAVQFDPQPSKPRPGQQQRDDDAMEDQAQNQPSKDVKPEDGGLQDMGDSAQRRERMDQIFLGAGNVTHIQTNYLPMNGFNHLRDHMGKSLEASRDSNLERSEMAVTTQAGSYRQAQINGNNLEEVQEEQRSSLADQIDPARRVRVLTKND